MLKTYHILATGPGISNFDYDLATSNAHHTIGVNSVCKEPEVQEVDTLLVVDTVDEANADGDFNDIVNSNCIEFVSASESWLEHFRSMTIIQLGLVSNEKRGNLKNLDSENIYPYSWTSAFVAVILAYRKGAKKIVLWGVDLVGHHTLSRTDVFTDTIKHFQNLSNELQKRGVTLFVGYPGNVFQNILPVYDFDKN